MAKIFNLKPKPLENISSKKEYSKGISIKYSPKDVMEVWMDSAGHKANILNKNHKLVGVGYSYINGVELENTYSLMLSQ